MDSVSIYKTNIKNVINEIKQSQDNLNGNSLAERKFIALKEIAGNNRKLQGIFYKANEEYNLMMNHYPTIEANRRN